MSSRVIFVEGVGEIRLTKSSRSKNIRLKINHDGEVAVSAPLYAPQYVIKKFVNSKADWIEKHQSGTRLILPGSKIGRSHSVSFIHGDKLKSQVRNNQIKITIPYGAKVSDQETQTEASKAAVRALKAEGKQIIPELVEHWAAVGVGSYKDISIKKIKSRWGSYSSSGNISISVYAMQLSDELIEYIVIHELAHSRHMNHSASFWKHVEKYCPNYKQLRKRLHEHKMRIEPR